MTPNSYFVIVHMLTPFWRSIAQIGLSNEDIINGLDLDTKMFTDPDKKIALETYLKIFNQCQLVCQDKFFGLHIGEKFFYLSGLLGYLIMSSATINSALQTYLNYQKGVENIKQIQIKTSEDNYIIEIFMPQDLDLNTQLSCYNLAAFISCFRFLTGFEGVATEIRFCHSQPIDISEYDSFFKAKLTFGADANALVIPKSIFNLPVISHSTKIFDLLEKELKQICVEQAHSYSERVKKEIINSLGGDLPTLSIIAKKLSLSSRTLQTRLNNEKTNYLLILNQTRRECAFIFLKDFTLPLSEISFMLGFSEPSAFHRSFKKWTGQTPNEWRKL